MRAEPPIPVVIGGTNRMLTDHSRPDQAINILDRLNLRLDDTQLLHDTRLGHHPQPVQYFFNTVILA